MIASSLYIKRTNIFNNIAQFGGMISACNSQVTLIDDGLFVTVDPLLPFCKLYDGDVRHSDVTLPPKTVITTELIATAELSVHTEEESDAVTSSTAAMDHSDTLATKTSTTPGPLSEGTELPSMATNAQSTTSVLISNNNDQSVHAGEETGKKVTVSIILSATSLIVFLIAILTLATMIILILCVRKKGSLRKTISKMNGFSINPSRTFSKLEHTSPIYNPNSSDIKLQLWFSLNLNLQ